MLRMYPQPINQSSGDPLGPQQHAHRLFPFEGHHAAAAPEVEVAHQPLEAFIVERRLGLVLRAATAFKGGDQESPVVGPAETVRRHVIAVEPARRYAAPSSSGCDPARRAWRAEGEPTSLIGGLRSSTVMGVASAPFAVPLA